MYPAPHARSLFGTLPLAFREAVADCLVEECGYRRDVADFLAASDSTWGHAPETRAAIDRCYKNGLDPWETANEISCNVVELETRRAIDAAQRPDDFSGLF